LRSTELGSLPRPTGCPHHESSITNCKGKYGPAKNGRADIYILREMLTRKIQVLGESGPNQDCNNEGDRHGFGSLSRAVPLPIPKRPL
jgi:hypothetical protein